MHSVCFFNGVVQCFELVKLSTYKRPVVAVIIIIIFVVVDRDCGERLGATVEGGLEAQHGPGHQHHLHLLLLLLFLTVPRGHSTLQGTVLIQTHKQLKRKAWNISHFIRRLTFRTDWISDSTAEMHPVNRFLAFMLLMQSVKQFLSTHHVRFRFVWILLTEMYRVNKFLAFVLLVQRAKHFLSIHRMRFTVVWISSTEMF